MGCIGSKEAGASGAAGSAEKANAPPVEKPKEVYKVLILGDASVGKSSLLIKYTEGKFPDAPSATLGGDNDYRSKDVEVDGTTVTLEVWDTAGQERFRVLTGSFYHSTAGALICFDIGNHATFENVEKWREQVETYGSPNMPVTLVGCKADSDNRAVTAEEAQAFALKFNIQYVETSAKTSVNVEMAFNTLASTIHTAQTKEEDE